MKNILQKIVFIGIMCVPATVLILNHSLMYPAITGKNFAFRILVEIITASWILLWFMVPEYRARFSWLSISILSFIGIVFIADIFGANPSKSFFSEFERMSGFITLLHLGAFFLVISSTLKTQRSWFMLFFISVGVSFIEAFYSILQFFNFVRTDQINADNILRVNGTFGNSMFFAGYMLIHSFLTLFILKKIQHRGLRCAVGVGFLLQIITLYLSVNRAGVIGFVGGVGVLVIASGIYLLKKATRKTIFISCSLILLSCIVLFGLRNSISSIPTLQPITQRLTHISLKDTTVDSRLRLWTIALKGFKDNPILGVGQENFNIVFDRYYDSVFYNQEPWFDRAHNMPIEWLSTTGILGCLLYFITYGAAFWFIKRNKTLSYRDKSIFISLLISYFIYTLFSFDTIGTLIPLYILFGYLHFTHSPLLEEKIISSVLPSYYYKTFGVFIGMSLLLCIYCLNIIPMTTAWRIAEARKTINSTPSESFDYFFDAVSAPFFGRLEAISILLTEGDKLQQSVLIPAEIKKSFITLGISAIKQNEQAMNKEERYLLSALGFLNKYGSRKDAEVRVAHAIDLSPQRQIIYFEKAYIELNNKQYDKAFATMKYAFELEPKNDDARMLYASTAFYTKDSTTGDKLLIDRFGTVIVDNYQILQTYQDTKMFDRVLELWKERNTHYPHDYATVISLATAYYDYGDKKQAIIELERAKKLDPTNTGIDEVINYIRQGKNPHELQ